MAYKTEQENFWAGSFGDDYIERNQGAAAVASNTALFSTILRRTESISSVIEFGANIGLNLDALRCLLPAAKLAAVEINEKAAQQLQRFDGITVHQSSILDLRLPESYDLVLIKGVLIHINPEELSRAYDALYSACARYLCVAEYYNPSPVEIPYRGHQERLFKRDFAGDLLDAHEDLRLVDYGFVYHRDTTFPQDDITWFLLEKQG